MRISDFFLALAAAHVRVHHLADDGAGPDDRDLHNEVVEASGRIVRDGSHLRAALDLKHAHGVSFAKCLVDERVFRQRGEIHFLAIVARDQLDGILEHGYHAQAEQVHLDQSEIGAVFLVPLNDSAARHGGALDGDNAIEHSGADNHAAGVLAKMARQVLHAQAEVKVMSDARMANVETCLREVVGHGIVFAAPLPMTHKARQPRQLILLEA